MGFRRRPTNRRLEIPFEKIVMTDKSIDFDLVADLYDVLVQVDFDLEFWKAESRDAGGNVLELMCGTGRIGRSLVGSGVSYVGVDYSEGLLQRFETKLGVGLENVKLVLADARSFELAEDFDLIFIGFNSLAEVIAADDKSRVLRQVHKHLKPGGRFTFSLHNPSVRSLKLDGKMSEPIVRPFEDGKRTLEFRTQFDAPSSAGIVSGKQFYVVTDEDGRELDSRKQDVRFHLITRDEIEALLERNDFTIQETWGDYDRSPLAENSPFMIFRCTLA